MSNQTLRHGGIIATSGSPELHSELHDCNGGDKSCKPRPSRKERLHRGRERDKARLASLREQLATRSSSDSEGSLEVSALQQELHDLRTKLALSVQKTAAIEAASNAALATALRVGNSLQHAQQIAGSTASALHNLAAADVYVLVQCGHQSCDNSPGPAPGLGIQSRATPSAEAVASAANGFCNTSLFPGPGAVASAANGWGDASFDDFNSHDLANTPGLVHFEIFDAGDADWLCANEPCADAANADAAAGVTASAGVCCHPEHHLSSRKRGGGTSVTTLLPAAHASLAFEEEASIASSQLDSCQQDGGGLDIPASLGTPGSSSPGSQNGGPRCLDSVSCVCYNEYQNTSSYCEGCDDNQQTGQTAVGGLSTIRAPLQSDGHTPGSEAMASGATGVDKFELKVRQFPVSEALASGATGVAQPELLSGQDMSLKDFNSQNLANTCVDTSSKQASPVLVTTIADPTASREESARQLENGSEEHGENSTQGGPAQRLHSANGMHEKDIDSRVPDAVAFVKRTAPHGLPPAVMEGLLVHIAKFAVSEFYSSADGNVNVQQELLQYNMEFFLQDAGFTAS